MPTVLKMLLRDVIKLDITYKRLYDRYRAQTVYLWLCTPAHWDSICYLFFPNICDFCLYPSIVEVYRIPFVVLKALRKYIKKNSAATLISRNNDLVTLLSTQESALRNLTYFSSSWFSGPQLYFFGLLSPL